MKKMFNFIFIIFIIFMSSITTIVFTKDNCLETSKENKFYPTQADMLNHSLKTTDEIENIYNQICLKIIKEYGNDKAFIEAFIKDKDKFDKYKYIQRDVILPHYYKDSTYYGSNYAILSDSYVNELILNKLQQYKRSLKLYCLYNDNKNESACCDKTIESIFKLNINH